MIRKLMKTLAVAGLMLTGHTAVSAYPDHVVKVVAPMSAGGGTDAVARLFAKKLEGELGQSVIVENKPGAGSQLGVEHVMNSRPDGYTLLFTSSSPLTLPYLRKTKFELNRDFTPIGQVGVGTFALVVNPKLPFNTAKEFLDAVKKNPGKYTYGSAGVGSAGHLAGELLQSRAGLEMVHIPFKSSGEISLALMGGQIDSSIDVLSVQKKQIEEGVVKGLATTGIERDPNLPNLPSLNETGAVPGGYEMTYWFAMFAPIDTPKDAVEKLRTAFASVMKDPEVVERVQAFSLIPSTLTPEQFAKNIEEQSKEWQEVITAAKITLEN
ncbi:putative secreted protein [Pusillimonas sp. T7-7]|uniref:Bug family tripartite tricarboxylate transporter substrate binding protein n=1 Tax=Pusillimonas sp. (strain T7-7) TaxID=1007105 RepID=UPI0002084F61|nr:tripartite tricarboxylate transporter substrate binding protein [Pusillimonas sp. T7-7]AEC21221.1 putative secreted protein [Pusillimonas sp. T7-7]